jgi:hypothetical protein
VAVHRLAALAAADAALPLPVAVVQLLAVL